MFLSDLPRVTRAGPPESRGKDCAALPGLGSCRHRCRQVPSPFTTESGETAAFVVRRRWPRPWRLPVVPTEVKSPTATRRAPPALGQVEDALEPPAAFVAQRHVVLRAHGLGRVDPDQVGTAVGRRSPSACRSRPRLPISSTALTSPLGLTSFRPGRVPAEGDHPRRPVPLPSDRRSDGGHDVGAAGRRDVEDPGADVRGSATDDGVRGQSILASWARAERLHVREAAADEHRVAVGADGDRLDLLVGAAGERAVSVPLALKPAALSTLVDWPMPAAVPILPKSPPA